MNPETPLSSEFGRELSVLFSGEAGQGIQTLERLILRLFKRSKYYVFSYSEFMSRVRGGNNSTELRISGRPVSSYLSRIDIIVPLSPGALDRFHDRIGKDTLILGDPSCIDDKYKNSGRIIEIPINSLAKEIGGPIYANILILGLFAGLFGIKPEMVRDLLSQSFPKLDNAAMQKNLDASGKGRELGKGLLEAGRLKIGISVTEESSCDLLMNGADAIALGGLAGGCNFVSSYPMSPSTDVLVNLAGYAGDFGIVVEQAEDEISAVNMAVASWYAGGRAMVTTSGGGFALMVEGLSLAGAIESPLVVHLGQRPGPATGLPTRTEQGDLLFSLFSGHGEFPRVIFAPGTLTEGILLTQRAFHLADKYQIPALVLTDQFFIDSYYCIPDMIIDPAPAGNLIVKTGGDYKRYSVNESGISPRGIPGYGSGLVCADSDEHDEEGHITEDFGVRKVMMDKRLGKIRALEENALEPELYGKRDYTYLLVSWGSQGRCIREALELSGRDDIALLHFSQVYPLHKATASYLNRARVKIIIENNATSQFGMLIKMHTGIDFDRKILKYNGMPFFVEEITDVIKSLDESGNT